MRARRIGRQCPTGDAHRGAVRRRRRAGHRGALVERGARHCAWPQRDRREPRRRRRHHRCGLRGEVAARRPDADPRRREPHHRRLALHQARLSPATGFQSDRAYRQRRLRADDRRRGAGENRGRVRRVRQSQSRQDELRQRRQRLGDASVDGVLRQPGRHRHGARAVQGDG